MAVHAVAVADAEGVAFLAVHLEVLREVVVLVRLGDVSRICAGFASDAVVQQELLLRLFRLFLRLGVQGLAQFVRADQHLAAVDLV